MNSGNKHLPTSSYNLMYMLSDEKQAVAVTFWGGVANTQSNVYTLQQCNYNYKRASSIATKCDDAVLLVLYFGKKCSSTKHKCRTRKNASAANSGR